MTVTDTAEDALHDPNVIECRARGIIDVADDRVSYSLNSKRSYLWTDPEEWVRCRCVAFLIVQKGYPANRMKTEVQVPRRTPGDFADIVIYEDDRCRAPYLIVENKSAGQSRTDRPQWIEQVFGNTNSLRGKFALYDEGLALDGLASSILFDVQSYPQEEREDNICGGRQDVPEQYGEAPEFQFIAGSVTDISAVRPATLESKIRRAHSLIWAGGKRDPLAAFDEWSKLLFAKVVDERHTPSGEARRFQVGRAKKRRGSGDQNGEKDETTAAVATRIHALFREACRGDPSIFPATVRINLNDRKIAEVVKVLQDVSLIRTDIDSVGTAFESFFSSVFRGELGQYFTMRQLARFVVAMTNVTHRDYVIDPTAGSGGFLLEALLQVWHSIDRQFRGQPEREIERLKVDFAQTQVYGIEIHEILSRILKINLLLHHDGHTNIEGNRSCLDSTFSLPRLMPPQAKFTCVVGNPPFGDDVEEGDEDHLGDNTLDHFAVAAGRRKAESEHVIIERSIELLEPGGRLGLVIPDGTLNNQAANCPTVRRLLMRMGRILAVVSLPDYAFRKAGAQNKTSLLFFRKFTAAEARAFNRRYRETFEQDEDANAAISAALEMQDYFVFLAEANRVGYAPTGAPSIDNDLYRPSAGGHRR